MGTVLWTMLAILIISIAIVWRSPLLVCAPSLLLGVALSENASSGSIDLNIVILVWLVTLFLSMYILRLNRVFLSKFRLSKHEFRHYRSMRGSRFGLLAFTVLYMIVVVYWLQQAGVTDFGSEKRSSSASAYFNIANYLLKAFTIYAVSILGFAQIKGFRYDFILAAIIMLGVFMIAFLSSSRSTFLAPMLIIMTARFLKISSYKIFAKYSFAAVLVLSLVFVFSATVAEHRAGLAGSGMGWSILSGQLSSEVGNGFSPEKDVTVLDFVYVTGQRMDPVILLGGFYGLVPRVLWEGKPEFVSSGPIAGRMVFGTHQNRSGSGAGIPISIPSEIAFSIGYWWYFVGFIIVTIFFVMGGIACKNYPFLVVPFLMICPTLIAGGLSLAQVSFLTSSVLILLVQKITNTRMCYASD